MRDQAAEPHSTANPEPRRIPLPWLLTPIVVLSLTGMLADAFGPALVGRHPTLQIFLNPRIRYLVLASPQIDAVPFFVIGFVRLVLTDPLFFLLGDQYGEAALRWLREKGGEQGSFVDTLVGWFGKAAPLVILIAPSGYLCALAGMTKMRLRTFVTMNLLGTIGRLVLIRLAGEAFEEQLETVLDFIRSYQWYLVAVSITIVAIQARRLSKRGLLDTPSEMEREIEQIEDDLDQP